MDSVQTCNSYIAFLNVDMNWGKDISQAWRQNVPPKEV
jgi:hypothetical protein